MVLKGDAEVVTFLLKLRILPVFCVRQGKRSLVVKIILKHIQAIVNEILIIRQSNERQITK
jgi:hypothetical protein